jgi:hypothetical protein
MTFAELLEAANQSKTDRKPGQWTPAACRAWRGAEPDLARLLEAAIAWEMTTGMKVQPDDEDIVRQRLREMEEATAAVKARTGS